jgi:phosphoglycolate phosphatase
MNGVVWDWNGTLLDDFDASLGAFNETLASFGAAPVTAAFYRDRFDFPVRGFYEASGLDLSRVDWPSLARVYHAAYGARASALRSDAREALEIVRAAGARQVLASAAPEAWLRASVERYGLSPYFDGVFGSDNLDGASKRMRVRAACGALRARDGAVAAVMVGDTVHDADIARAEGVGCVLFSGGCCSRARLAVRAPTFGRLTEAARAALAWTPAGGDGRKEEKK